MQQPARASRRPGIRGKVGPWQAVLVVGSDELQVRTMDLAETIGAALDAAPHGASPVSGRVRRYSTTRSRKGMTLVLADERGRDRGRFGAGFVARTSSRALAERVADVLNALDPAVFKPPPKGAGVGWW